MRQYENMLLLDSTLEEQEEKDLLGRLLAMVERAGGRVLDTESWGKRKCAYPVKKQTHAYYELVWFEGDNSIVDEIRRQYRITDGILKYLIVKPTRPVVPGSAAEGREAAPSREAVEGPRRSSTPQGTEETTSTAQVEALPSEREAQDSEEETSGVEDETSFSE